MKKAPKDTLAEKEKFIAAARELGCDMTQEEFAQKLKGIGSVKPMTQAQVKKKAKKGNRNAGNS